MSNLDISKKLTDSINLVAVPNDDYQIQTSMKLGSGSFSLYVDDGMKNHLITYFIDRSHFFRILNNECSYIDLYDMPIETVIQTLRGMVSHTKRNII